jgi:hypothetical protein
MCTREIMHLSAFGPNLTLHFSIEERDQSLQSLVLFRRFQQLK